MQKLILRSRLMSRGNCCFSVLALINMLKKKGMRIWDIITTQRMPMIEMIAIDLNAGCFANINTPRPAIVVIAERKIDDL